MDREKVIKELHDARRYLEDKEWSDRGASPHIDAINDALALLKEQQEQIENKIHNFEFLAERQQPQIVRCKDCKYWKQYESYQIGECEIYKGYNRSSNWFCADGEMSGNEV